MTMTNTQMAELDFELFGVAAQISKVKTFAGKDRKEKEQQARRLFTLAPLVRSHLDGGGWVQEADGETYEDHVGFSATTVSAIRNIGRIVHYVTTGEHGESTTELQQSKTVDQAKRLEAIWNERFPEGDADRVSFTAACMLLESDSPVIPGIETTRALVAEKMRQAFKSVQDALKMARPPKDDDQDDDQDDQDKSGSQSWQEMVAEAARRALEADASISDVVALVNQVYGS